MRQDHTDITIVLDRSGSMVAVAGDTIGGYNRFLADQKAAPGTAAITLVQFDHEYTQVTTGQDVKAAEDLTTKTFVPRGNTALYDAIGRAVAETGARLAALPQDQRPGKVVFVVITDGFENASREYTSAKVQEAINHQRDKYKWEFVFLGANQDAIKTAGGIGISVANAMTYASNSRGTASAFAATSSNCVRMRSAKGGQSVSMAYTADQREEQKAAGAVA